MKGTVRLRGTVVEVKASNVPGQRFGKLPDRGRDQILDAVDYVRRLRQKANLVKDLEIRRLLQKAKVEVYSDFEAPKSGKFADLIRAELIEWHYPIPR